MTKHDTTPRPVFIAGQKRNADSLKNAIICVLAAIGVTIAVAIVNGGG